MLEGKERKPVFERLAKVKPISERVGVDEPIDIQNVASNAQIKMHRGAPIQVALYDLNKMKNQKLIDSKKN